MVNIQTKNCSYNDIDPQNGKNNTGATFEEKAQNAYCMTINNNIDYTETTFGDRSRIPQAGDQPIYSGCLPGPDHWSSKPCGARQG